MKKQLQSLFILLCFGFAAMAQDRTITGTVKNTEDGQPIPGVTVKVKEASHVSVQTSSDGKFSISVPSNGKTLVFFYLGYETKEVTIQSSSMEVMLTASVTGLNEVVVTAGGLSARKAQLGAATTTIKAQELMQGKATNIAAALTGKAAGLQLNVVGTGVNPNYRLVLRGNRSLLGNNEALIVVDNVIVPSNILGSLNPEDIEDLQVLNGGGAAALYGSDASNGALIITTKKGKKGRPVISFGQTTSAEQVSFFPKLQNRFGSGTSTDIQIYNPHENQQYGPAFDGKMVQIGDKLEDGSIQTIPYLPNNSKKDFWATGYTNQSDFSLSTGDDKSTHYLSAQYVDVTGTTPKDKYNRFTLRLNGTRTFSKILDANFSVYYAQNRENRTTSTSSMYNQILQTPAHIPLTSYQDWKNDKFANPNGYYNAFYANPYFTLDNSRNAVRNDYLIGNVDFRLKATDWLSFLYRVNINTTNSSNKSHVNKFILSEYTKKLGLSDLKNNDITGSVNDAASYSTQLLTELQANISKRFATHFKLDLTVGTSLRNNTYKGLNVAASGLTFEGLYNVAHRLNANITGGEGNSTARQQGLYADLRLGYKNFLYLHASGRNDWFSTLPIASRSIFYPSIDASFIATNAIEGLKNNKILTSLKLRANYSTVGNVNLSPYSLLTTFGQAGGYPYNNNPGYAISNTLYNPDLKPEKTNGFETGFDVSLFADRFTGSLTYFNTSTVDQIVPVNISAASNFSRYYTNTGEVSNKGIESSWNLVPFKTLNWEINVGGTYTYYNNKVLSISNDITRLGLSTGGDAQTYAEAGQLYPILRGSAFKRDPEGRIIVDSRTGYPSATETVEILGNASPKHILSLNATINFKGLRLAAVAEYRGGYSIFNADAGLFEFSGSGERTVLYNRERFVIPNSSYWDPAVNAYVPNTSVTVRDGGAGFWAQNSQNTDIAENYVVNGAYWKIREISLGYQIPQKWLGKQNVIKAINVSIQGRNLFLFTPKENRYTDPDYMLGNNAIGINTLSQIPPTRFYGGSVSVTF